MYSRPFVLTCTLTYPERARVELHTNADSLTYAAARTADVPNRHSSKPADSDAPEKPRPDTVTVVPPSDEPRDGHTEDTLAAARYVKRTPLDANCCPFKDTDTKRAPAPADGGDTHTMLEPPPASQPRTGTMRESPYRHSYGAPIDAADIPSVTIVPPCTGPADGVAALTCTSAYT